ncbi:hypothetical protein T484DRAFT_1820096 [Baffinella frigidus]|nr:hypothetical protein T484DRAFT_1820096 [Cryptophyta sp. CCMP2293]
MLGSLLVLAPAAVHGRVAAMLGDSAALHFIPHTSAAQKLALQLPSESVDRVYVEFPDVADSVDDSVFPELIRVLVKGGKITVRHREGAKSFEDRLVFGGCVDTRSSPGDGVMLEATGMKPVWDAGAAVPLSLRKRTSTQPPAPTAKKVWAVSADDGGDLMDEDTLLTAED